MLIQDLATLFLIKLSASAPGRPWITAQMLEFLPTLWETWMELLVPASAVDQLQLQEFGKSLSPCPLFPFVYHSTFRINLKNQKYEGTPKVCEN